MTHIIQGISWRLLSSTHPSASLSSEVVPPPFSSLPSAICSPPTTFRRGLKPQCPTSTSARNRGRQYHSSPMHCLSAHPPISALRWTPRVSRSRSGAAPRTEFPPFVCLYAVSASPCPAAPRRHPSRCTYPRINSPRPAYSSIVNSEAARASNYAPTKAFRSTAARSQ